jgi:hypothetical protein
MYKLYIIFIEPAAGLLSYVAISAGSAVANLMTKPTDALCPSFGISSCSADELVAESAASLYWIYLRSAAALYS